MAQNLQTPVANVRLYLDDIITGTAGGPEFSTDITINHGGYEQRNANWDFPLGRWDVGQRGYCQSTKDYIVSFFRQRRGKFQGFLWRDLSDWQATASPLPSEAGFTTQGWVVPAGVDTGRLIKRYSDGTYVADRLIQAPIASSLLLPAGWSIGGLGVVNAPGIAADTPVSFHFDTPVRFDADGLRINLQSTEGTLDMAEYEAIFYVDSLPLVEVRLTQPLPSAAYALGWAQTLGNNASPYSASNAGLYAGSQTTDTGEDVSALPVFFKILEPVPLGAQITFVGAPNLWTFSYDAINNLGVVNVAYSNIRGYAYIYPGTVTINLIINGDIVGQLQCIVVNDAYADLQWLAFAPL